jgi:glycine betaine/choline ABC-type transport system substrate-binding protein
MMTRSLRTAATLIAVLGMMLASMAGISSVAAQDDDKPTITVGSKNFTEQIILGEMVSLILEDAGYDVERRLNLGGLAVVHEALVAGEIDVYVEYTGTGLVAVLGRPVPTVEGTPAATPAGGAAPATPAASVADLTYQQVSEAYLEEFGLVWLDELGFNNTYALAVTQETAEEYDLETTSDLAEVADELTLGTDPEVLVREDGLPGLQEAYDFEFEDAVGMDSGLMYSSVASGDVDVITAFTTDGRIEALDLVLLEDDKNYFPPYYAAPVVRQELLEEYPELEEVLNQLAGQIDNETMAAMNYQVDEEGAEPRDVAQAFLEEQGIIGGEE